MISVKFPSALRNASHGVSSGQFLAAVSLFSLVIVGGLATAATKTTDGYVLLKTVVSAVSG